MKNRRIGAAATAVAIAGAFGFLFLKDTPSRPPAGAPRFGQLPAHFEPTGRPGSYAARGTGYALDLDARGATLRLRREGKQSSLALQLEGAQLTSPIAESTLPGVSNYFLGSDPARWRTQVQHFARVRYASVYPGIDLVYYGKGRELEYDFAVAPGADPSRIRLSYGGASSMRIDDSGNLRIAVEGGEVVHRKPIAFEVLAGGARRAMESAFRILRTASTTVVSFDIGARDPRLPLVIDPVLTYATYLGGTDDNEEIDAIAIDAAGAVYVAGITTSADFPVTAGASQGTVGGGFDAFVAKLNPQGTALEYATYLGGASLEEVHALRIDAGGNAYIAGATDSANFPVTTGAAQVTSGGGRDAYVAKLNTTGATLLYSTYIGGAASEPASGRLGGFAVDSAGNAYVYGDTESVNFPTTAGAPQTARGNPNGAQFDEDLFLTRLNATGTALTFSTYHGGGSIDAISEVSNEPGLLAIDDSGSAWIVGTTESSDFPTTAGAFDTTFNGPSGGNPGGGDAFVARYDTTAGTRAYSTLIGATADEFGVAIAVDAAGNAYIAARTASTGFPTTAGAFDTGYNGGNGDVAVAKLNPTGSALVYSTFLGGTQGEAPSALRLDGAGTLYVAGSTQSTNFPVSAGAADATHNGGGNDGFVAHLSAAGNALLYSTFAGSSDSDGVGLLEIDAAGGAYALLGDTAGDAVVTTGGLTHAGNGDDYFIKLNSGGTAFLDASYLGGAEDDFSLAMAIDAQQNLYLAGVTTSANFPTTAGVVQPANAGAAGDEDSFVAKFATTPEAVAPQPGALALTAAAFTVAEGAGTLTIAVARSGGTSGQVGASCTSSSAGTDTATTGTDYTAASSALTWADGDSANKTCIVTISDDASVEGDETFTVTLANATGGATLGAPTMATVTITDNDVAVPQPGSIQFSPATYSANENGGSVTLTLTRTNGADGAISVSVNSGGGSASAGADYTALTQTVSWPANDSTPKTVALALLEDPADEPDETVSVTLSNATGGATLGTASATVTIVDNDATPPPPVQNGNAKGSYGGGAMDWSDLTMLAALVFVSTLAGKRRGNVSGAPPARTSRRASISRHARVSCWLAVGVLAISITPVARATDGWYVGVRGGAAESTLEASDVANALAAAAHNVDVALDEHEPTLALFGGYRWASGFALEGGVIDLGEYDAEIDGTTSSPSTLLSDGGSLLADAGRGVSASLAWTWPLGERFEITPRVGAYYWESRRELSGSAGRLRADRHGVDFTGGLALAWNPAARWSIALGWETWVAGSRNDVRAWTAALTYRFGK